MSPPSAQGLYIHRTHLQKFSKGEKGNERRNTNYPAYKCTDIPKTNQKEKKGRWNVSVICSNRSQPPYSASAPDVSKEKEPLKSKGPLPIPIDIRHANPYEFRDSELGSLRLGRTKPSATRAQPGHPEGNREGVQKQGQAGDSRIIGGVIWKAGTSHNNRNGVKGKWKT